MAAALLAQSLVDELQLFVNPTAVHGGRSTLDDVLCLRLAGSKVYECGIVVNPYFPGRRRLEFGTVLGRPVLGGLLVTGSVPLVVTERPTLGPARMGIPCGASRESWSVHPGSSRRA